MSIGDIFNIYGFSWHTFKIFNINIISLPTLSLYLYIYIRGKSGVFILLRWLIGFSSPNYRGFLPVNT